MTNGVRAVSLAPAAGCGSRSGQSDTISLASSTSATGRAAAQGLPWATRLAPLDRRGTAAKYSNPTDQYQPSVPLAIRHTSSEDLGDRPAHSSHREGRSVERLDSLLKRSSDLASS
jgi:hypothetical protein